LLTVCLLLLDGHYLNLPVLEDGSIVGIVDVLKLTYATLEQVNKKMPILCMNPLTHSNYFYQINSIQGSDGEGKKEFAAYTID
jgi:hypothetical protein